MNKYKGLLLAVIVVVYTGCSSVPTKDIKVDAEADPKANFSGYKSYTWLGSLGVLHDPEGQWQPPGFDADQEVRFLINRELRKRGMSEDSNNPDLDVAFGLGVDMQSMDLKRDPETKMEMMENVPRGALVVDLIDSETGFVIWTGVAVAEIKEADTATAKARLDYAVTQMFKKLPK